MGGRAIYWVNTQLGGPLAVISRPRRADDLWDIKSAGIDVLVSLLEPGEARGVGLADEAMWCAHAGIDFINIPILDHGVPSDFESFEYALEALADHLRAGRGVGTHCYAGLGRSPLTAASILIHHGWAYHDAVAAVSAARGYDVPETDGQHRWLARLQERYLRRNGGQ